MNSYLADARSAYSVDMDRVILLGAASGGQMALTASQNGGANPAGVAVFGAYPVKSGTDLSLALPPDSAKDRTAFLFLCGARDGGVRVCRAAEEALAAKGFSVRTTVVPGTGIEWTPAVAEAAAGWIGMVAEGKRPAGAPLTLSPEARKAAEAMTAKIAAIVCVQAVALPKDACLSGPTRRAACRCSRPGGG